MSLITTCMTQFFRYLEITYSLYAANQRATISKEALDPPGSSGEAWQSKRWIGIADADSKCAKAIWKSGVRSDERRILLFFLPWLVSRCNFFFFFFIDYCIRQTREISLLVRIDVRLIATENKLIATHKLKDQSVNWILQLLTEALSITASTGVDPLSRASSSCNQSRTCRASGWASGRT